MLPIDLQPMVDWLFMPLSGVAIHNVEPWAAWHARLMVVAWALALPLGVLAARYFKVTRRQDWPHQLDNKAWWHAHLGLQWAGLLAMSVGLALAWGRAQGTSDAARLHAWLGWGLIAAAALQAASGLARGSKGGPTDLRMRGDHFDMTPRRVAFERLHKSLGHVALVVAVVVVALGLWVADAPRWMALGLAAWWAVLLAVFAVLQRRGLCIDTYQAIWGADPRLPGNQRAPIGWGVRRIEPRTDATRP